MSKQNDIEIDDFPSIGGVMASKMITEEHKKPIFMYREKRYSPNDSGWRIYSGLESEEYSNNPDNFGFYNPSTILAVDSSIAELLLKGGVGSVFERKSDESSWHKVDDYPLEDDYMVKHPLTDEWELTINNLFERQIEEDGELFYTTGDKSLRMVIWNREENKADLYKEYQEAITNRDESPSKTLETFDFSDDKVIRIGYLIKESNENREYSLLCGFSIIDKQVVLATFYFDDPNDISWAVDTWKGIALIEECPLNGGHGMTALP